MQLRAAHRRGVSAALLTVAAALQLPGSSPSQVDLRNLAAAGRGIVLDGQPGIVLDGQPPISGWPDRSDASPVTVPAGRPLIVPVGSIAKPVRVDRADDGEDEEDGEDHPLRLAPLGRPRGEQSAAAAPPMAYTRWIPPDAVANSGPLRHVLQELAVQQDFEVSPTVGYTLQFSTAADLPLVTAAFVKQAAADGHSLIPSAGAAILLALQEAAVNAIRSTAQPPLTPAQWSAAAQLDPSNVPLALEARQQTRRGAVRIGLHSSPEFDGVARSLYNYIHGDEHVAPFLGSLVRMIRPMVVVELGGGSYVTPFLLRALADNVIDFEREANDSAEEVLSNYLRPWYFEEEANSENNTHTAARLRLEHLTPVLHCIHSGAGEPKAATALSKLGLEASLLHVHQVAADDILGFSTRLSENLTSAVDLLWFGSDEHGQQDTGLLPKFIDAYIPLLKKDQGYFVVQFTHGFFGRNFGEEIPWSDGVEELRSRIQAAANADLSGNQADTANVDASREEEQTKSDDMGNNQVEVEMIHLLEPHKWRAGSLSLFKLSRVGARAPLGNVLLSQQIRLGFDALARETPAEAAAHFNGGVRVAEQYQLNPADAEFGHGIALSLAATKQARAATGRLDEPSHLSEQADSAIAAFKRAIDANPTHAAAHNNLAMLLARTGDEKQREEAIVLLQRAVKYAPTWSRAYQTWGQIHADAGDREKELGVYELALENGVAWGSVLQRPPRLLRGLPTQEFYDPRTVTLLPTSDAAEAAAAADVDLSQDEHWVAALEREWVAIRDEVLSVLATHSQKQDSVTNRPGLASQSTFGSVRATGLLGLSGEVVTEAPGALARRVGSPQPGNAAENRAASSVAIEEAAGRGLWSEVRLIDEGRVANPTAWENFPHTMKVLSTLLGQDPLINAAGVVKFSWLAPGARIIPHVGPHNLRLRLHLALVVPSESRAVQIRVGNSRSQWVEGKALIFDESFEHEVWNNATTPRLVLIIDVWQPALEMDARRKLLELRERWKRDERSFVDGLFQAPSG